MPKEISSLVDSTFLFKVETNISTDARFEKSYRVRRISINVEFMKKFTRVPTVCALLWLKLFIISFNLHYWFFFIWYLCPKLIFGNFFFPGGYSG